MAETLYNHFRLQLTDVRQGTAGGKAITASGGTVLVCNTGTSVLASLFTKSGGTYSAATQPLTFSGGILDFYIQQPATGEPQVDLYGVAPGGQAFALYEYQSNSLPELCIDAGLRDHVLLVPWAIANMAAPATEYKTGLQLPAGALVSPFQALNTQVLETTGTATLKWGILSSESGGNSAGFGTGVSTAAVAVVPVQSAATTTRGALVGGATLDHEYAVAAASQDISYTGNATNATGAGLIHIPYRLPFAPTDVGMPSVDTFM